MEPVPEKPAKPIKIKLRRHDRDTDDLVQRVNQETTEEEVEEEPTETLQRRPRMRDNEQHVEKSTLRITFTTRPQPSKHESMQQKIGTTEKEHEYTGINVENPRREKPREYKTPNQNYAQRNIQWRAARRRP